MAAEVLAGELELDLYLIDLSGVVSKYIGETEKNLRRIFEAAEEGAILFDEADALFGKRTDVKDSHDRYANIEVSYLLERMDAYQGLAILTTNVRTAIDRAFQRRIRFVVSFPFPDAPHRELIWRGVFPRETPVGRLDWKRLAALDLSGGSIRNIAVNAAFLAAEAGGAGANARTAGRHRGGAREARAAHKRIGATRLVGHPNSFRVHIERVVIHGRPVESEVLAAAIEHGLRHPRGIRTRADSSRPASARSPDRSSRRRARAGLSRARRR